MKPLFSIITITYNAAETIEPTFRSVVGQFFTDYEYIVVDGDSKDGTVDFLRSRKDCLAVFISEPDKGLYDAMNKGMHLAKGEYLIFLNAGDTFHSENTLADIAVSIGSSRPDVIYGETALVNDKREFLGMRRLKTPETLNWKSFRMGMLVCHQAFIAKRTLAPDYDLSYRFSSDFDWCIRCMKRAGTLWNTHLTLIDYLNEVRIDHACVYLEQNFFKTYEIAYKVGFRDEKYFSKVFRKVMEMSPSEYKKRSKYGYKKPLMKA